MSNTNSKEESSMMNKVVGNIAQMAAITWFVARVSTDTEIRSDLGSIFGFLLMIAVPVGLIWFVKRNRQFFPHAVVVLFLFFVVFSFIMGTDINDVKSAINWPLDWGTVVWFAIIVAGFGFGTKMLYPKRKKDQKNTDNN